MNKCYALIFDNNPKHPNRQIFLEKETAEKFKEKHIPKRLKDRYTVKPYTIK